jgi:hypothetical protein
MAGVEPDQDFINKYACGSTAGPKAAEGLITGIANGTMTNVAVASYDLVGNVGPLSPIVCAAPQFVKGFDELYHQAGGTAGEGFCSISHGRRGRPGAWFAGFSLLGFVWALRRRYSSSNLFDSESH